MAVQGAESELDALSLHPPVRRDNLADPLEVLVPRIGYQYGGFHNVTEQKLRREIAEESQETQEREDHDMQGEEEVDVPPEDRKGSVESIYARKREMTAFLSSALQNTLMAVDFLSLLESKTRPQQAAVSMSPSLKEAGLKPGSLDHEAWEGRADPRAAEEGRLALIGRTMEGLINAADSLRSAASRLEDDVKRETEYWKHLLSVTERKWSVYRAPGKRAVALQFGANEAGPLFRNRGYAELVANEDGSIRLEQAVPMKPKALRVRHQRGNQTIAIATANPAQRRLDSADELEAKVREARDSLFEEEVFQELATEARGLGSFGVENRDGVLMIPLGRRDKFVVNECIQVDLIARNEIPDPPESQHSTENLAGIAALAFKLLLSHAFRQRYRYRTAIPPPLSEGKKPEQPTYILRPFLAYLQHEESVNTLVACLKTLQRLFRHADVDLSIEVTPCSTLQYLKATIAASSDGIFDLCEKFMQPLDTTFIVVVKARSENESPKSSRSSTLKIEVHTQLMNPTKPDFGTNLKLSLPIDIAKALYSIPSLPSPPATPPTAEFRAGMTSNTQIPRSLSFTEVNELASFLANALAVQTAHTVLLPSLQRITTKSTTGHSWIPLPRTAGLATKLMLKGGKKTELCIGVQAVEVELEIYREVGMRGHARREVLVAWRVDDEGRDEGPQSMTIQSFLLELQEWIVGLQG